MKKTKIAAALTGSVLYSVLAGPAAAQTAVAAPSAAASAPEKAAPAAADKPAPAPPVDNDAATAPKAETIVIQGYRGAIKKALDNKLTADSIMDSIVADDIGKLPEQNIAEAISRLPGVTISRSRGEGQFITVRGLGPAFSSALLNGRVLATENQGREYSFDILPAELISGVDVYKSPTATLVEGGIGSTVNMSTAQPLDIGNKLVLVGQGNYDRQRGEFSPQASGLFSRKSEDGTLGALVAFSFMDRKIEGRRIFTDGFLGNQTVKGTDGNPISGVSVPTWTEYDINRTTRKRSSALGSVQWKPSRTLTVTADALYSKLDVNDDSKVFFAGSDTGLISNAVVNANNTVTSYTGGWGEGLVSFSRPRLAETKAGGLNVKWDHSPSLVSVFDFATSRATDRNGGNQNWFEVNPNASGFSSSQLQYQLGPNNLPTYSNLGNIYDTSRATVSGLVWEGQSVEDKVGQASYTGKYKAGDGQGLFKSLDFGLNYSDREKTRSIYTTPGLWGLFSGIPVPQDLFSTAAHSTGFMGSGMFDQPFPSFDARALQAYLLSDAVIAQTSDPAATRDYLATHGNGFGVELVPGASGSAREKTVGGFVQSNFAGAWGERFWSANVGLRYVRTDITSKGVGQEVIRIDSPPPGQTGERTIVLSDPIPLTVKGSYQEWLPSANFKLDLTDNLLLQTSVSKTMTRATLSDLLIARTINARFAERRISEGNPGLKPMIAWNYDVSLTWFDGKGSYLSGALFSKRLKNLAETQTSTVTVVGESFMLTRPENVGKDSMHGVELGGQYLFTGLPSPLDGLGVLGNITYVSGSARTYNISGFYQKGPIELRVGYNFRPAYRETDSGRRSQPEDIAAYGELNASLNYSLNKNVTLFLQGINLGNEKIHSYSVYPERLINYESYGPRYAIGARISL